MCLWGEGAAMLFDGGRRSAALLMRCLQPAVQQVHAGGEGFYSIAWGGGGQNQMVTRRVMDGGKSCSLGGLPITLLLLCPTFPHSSLDDTYRA